MQTNNAKAMNRRTRKHYLVCLLAVFALALSQTIALQHSHDGDLNLRYDCHVCLKLGSADDGISATVIKFTASSLILVFHVEPVQLPERELPLRSARAPPIAPIV
ncbi:MAG: hypothetical protein WD772_08305 [Pseudohongiellaceae bacterium]